MDQRKELLALLINPDAMVGTVQWYGQNIHYIVFTLYPAERRLIDWCLDELSRLSPYVSAEAYFRQTLEIKCLCPDIDYSGLSWRDMPIDRLMTLAAIEQARAKLIKLLSSCNNAIFKRTS